MNVRTIALAISLIVPAAAAFAAEGVPYTGPNEPVMTTASNDVVTQDVFGRRNTADKDKTLAMKYLPTDKEKEIDGWRNTAGADKTFEATGKDETLEAKTDARIYTPTAN